MPEWIIFLLEALVVVGCIIMGTRSSGVGVGLWGGVGVGILVFVFGEAPGEPPTAAVAIILAVVTAASMMQAAGGIDWMVKVAAGVIESRPRQITLIAPLTAFVFSVGAGTSNILYPLMPVIYDVSYRNGIRPSRPMAVSVVQSGVALPASPVSAAMAAMLTLTDVAPYDLGLIEILAITFPACVIGIIVTSLVANRMGKELAADPEVQGKIRAGLLPPIPPAPPARKARGAKKGVASSEAVSADASPTDGPVPAVEVQTAASKLTSTKEGRNAALVFLSGVIVIVILGLFPGLRPALPGAEGEAPLPLGM